jgi:hypothetical protein
MPLKWQATPHYGRVGMGSPATEGCLQTLQSTLFTLTIFMHIIMWQVWWWWWLGYDFKGLKKLTSKGCAT